MGAAKAATFGAAETLLKIVARHPEVLREVMTA
jgi:hypothetical protein